MELLIIKVIAFSASLVTGITYAKQQKYDLAMAWGIGTICWFTSFALDFLSFTYPW